MRVLVTGFGPFEDVVDNPSERVARMLAAEGLHGHEVVCEVLPVSFRRAAARLRELLAEPFDAAVLLGAARGEQAIRLERQAANRAHPGLADGDGELPPDGPLDPQAPDVLRTSLPVEELAAAVAEAGIPARVSEDAGGYVCNAAYFAVLSCLRTAGRGIPCLFVHLPPYEHAAAGSSDGRLPLSVQAEAVRRILRGICQRQDSPAGAIEPPEP